MLALFAVCLAAAAVGCGSDDAESGNETAAASGEYAEVKNFLLGQTEQLQASTATLAEQAQSYSDLIGKAGSCEAALEQDPDALASVVEGMQATWKQANPQYEKSEGVVAGVPELAEFDVILDAGSSAADDPESAVPFDLKYADGTVLKQPGNFFYLTETSLWGTEDKFTCEGVEPDLNADGEVEFGEALPNPQHIQAATADMKKNADELAKAAKDWTPNQDDVFTALVVMTPTMSEYFDAWKNSRFVAGDDAEEASFVGSSRLNDIADILSGLVLVYDNIEPQIAETDPDQAKQTGEELAGLLSYVEDIRDQESDGKTFTAEQADTYGAEAQERAERIAGQVSQSASALGVNIQE